MQPRIPGTQKGAIAANICKALKVCGNTLLHVLEQGLLLLGQIGRLYEWKAHVGTPDLVARGPLGRPSHRRCWWCNASGGAVAATQGLGFVLLRQHDCPLYASASKTRVGWRALGDWT